MFTEAEDTTCVLSALCQHGATHLGTVKFNAIQEKAFWFIDELSLKQHGKTLLNKGLIMPRVVIALSSLDTVHTYFNNKPFALLRLPIQVCDVIKIVKSLYKLENKSLALAKIALPTMSGKSIVKLADIVRFETDASYTIVYFKDKPPQVSTLRLKDIRKKITAFGFYQVHQSHVINMQYINEIKVGRPYFIKLYKGQEVPVAPKRCANFLYAYERFVGGIG